MDCRRRLFFASTPNPPQSKIVIPVCTFFLLVAAPLSAQIVGGGPDTFFEQPGIAAGDYYGYSVSGAGDSDSDGFDEFIVGAPHADFGSYFEAGSVEIKTLHGGFLSVLYGSASNDHFGWSVSDAGDVNGDGFADVIIGAPGYNLSTGAAYVFSPATGAYLYQWFGSASGDNFGTSVSGAGDVDGDGYSDLLVGAYGTDGGALIDAGSAFVYSGATGLLLYRWNGGDHSEYFGWAVSDAGDFNNDGFDDLLIGAPFSSPFGLFIAGSAHVYSGATGALLGQWSGPATLDRLGYSVSGVGDVNNDGFDDIIVGTPESANGLRPRAGLAMVYSGATGNLLYEWRGAEARDTFGHSVSGAGDVNADGYADLVVGAPGVDLITGSAAAPSAFVYSGVDGSLLQEWHLGGDLDWFGSSVSNVGDINYDGFDDIIIGAHKTTLGGLASRGSTTIHGFHTFMQVNVATVSATAGGTIDFALDFPEAAAADQYKILVSATGVGPINYGIDIPLTQDSVLMDSFFGIYPVPNYANLHGILDAFGNGNASLTVPAGIPAGLVGRTYYVAAIANQAGQLPEYSSTAFAVEITL